MSIVEEWDGQTGKQWSPTAIQLSGAQLAGPVKDADIAMSP